MTFTLAWGAFAPLLLQYLTLAVIIYVVYYKVVLKFFDDFREYRQEHIQKFWHGEQILFGLAVILIVSFTLLSSHAAPKRMIENRNTNARIERTYQAEDIVIVPVPERTQTLEGFVPLRKRDVDNP